MRAVQTAVGNSRKKKGANKMSTARFNAIPSNTTAYLAEQSKYKRERIVSMINYEIHAQAGKRDLRVRLVGTAARKTISTIRYLLNRQDILGYHSALNVTVHAVEEANKTEGQKHDR